jgi:hypothetical protein
MVFYVESMTVHRRDRFGIGGEHAGVGSRRSDSRSTFAPARCFSSSAAAMGDRQTFAVHTTRIRIRYRSRWRRLPRDGQVAAFA